MHLLCRDDLVQIDRHNCGCLLRQFFFLSVICFIGNITLIFKSGYPPPPPPTEIHMMVILNDQFTLTRQQRGNLNTRFRKLSEDGSTYAAIILAVSGLERMNWHHLISEVSQPYVRLGDSLFQWFW